MVPVPQEMYNMVKLHANAPKLSHTSVKKIRFVFIIKDTQGWTGGFTVWWERRACESTYVSISLNTCSLLFR